MFAPKEAIWWSNLRRDMHTTIGRMGRLMPVSLEAAKSAPFQLLAGGEEPGVSVTTHLCVRTIARSTDESTRQLLWQVYAGDYCLSHNGGTTTFEGRYESACAQQH